MDQNFNRQFIQIDFGLLDDPRFLRFVGQPEFTTYLILRRYVWRGSKHRLGLDQLYEEQRLLASALSREKIAEKLGFRDVSGITKHLASLERLGVLKRRRTGRETIFVLGEWTDISEKQDGSARKEWFYVERVFAPASPDQDERSTSERGSRRHLIRTSNLDQASVSSLGQMQTTRPAYNREHNRETTVNVPNGEKKSQLKNLNDLEHPHALADLIAEDIISAMGDEHSRNYYRLVAKKVPEHLVRQALSEVLADGSETPRKAFTHRMESYAREQLVRKARAGKPASWQASVAGEVVGRRPT